MNRLIHYNLLKRLPYALNNEEFDKVMHNYFGKLRTLRFLISQQDIGRQAPISKRKQPRLPV